MQGKDVKRAEDYVIVAELGPLTWGHAAPDHEPVIEILGGLRDSVVTLQVWIGPVSLGN